MASGYRSLSTSACSILAFGNAVAELLASYINGGVWVMRRTILRPPNALHTVSRGSCLCAWRCFAAFMIPADICPCEVTDHAADEDIRGIMLARGNAED